MEKLGEGYRFHPTDGEGLTFLLRFIAGQVMNDSGFITTNVDVYGKHEPWQIYDHGVPCGDDDDDDDDSDCTQYRYFITKLKKKSKSKYNRNVGNKGSWKQQDKGKPVIYSSSSPVIIGCKKSMSYVNKGYNKKDGNWLMKEYELSSVILQKFDEDCRDYVLCAIKKRPVTSSCHSETSTVTILNNFPDEVTCNSHSESETMGFLNFQESHQAVESNSTADEPLQLVERYDAGDSMQSNSSVQMAMSQSQLDVLEWDKNDLEELEGMLRDMQQDDMNIGEPLLATEASYTAMLNFVPEDVLSFDPWEILLDIDQILQGT
ncbi:NAC domain-containing protein 55-like [Lycium barbarum]|uniref:NAC domain-containing protein 55-like n=1 Tax=Lycium barbarum TaxID=112863 RepID=UPI00293E1B0C|nr:NAC domain-containing protein 55-like [Lycium barbarum]